MPSYLVERYLPAARAGELDCAIAALAGGDGLRHLRATLVPEDETCFHVVEAPSRQAVTDALRQAAIAYERVVEAVEPAAGAAATNQGETR
jgi:hypothetical protein